MTKVVLNRAFPVIDRDSFLTPFDRMFDQIVESNFPDITKSVGVKPFQGTAYPKVNVYEYDDKVGVVAEIPGLDKKDLSVEVEDGVLTISGDKHGLFDDKGAKVIRRELKHSSFKRSFELGELLVYEYDDKVGVVAEIPGLDKKDLSVEVEDGVLTISGDKHGLFDDKGAKVIRRELKHSSFKRSFELGELLDGDNIKASFKDGLLSIEIPKAEPELPKKTSVKIS